MLALLHADGHIAQQHDAAAKQNAMHASLHGVATCRTQDKSQGACCAGEGEASHRCVGSPQNRQQPFACCSLAHAFHWLPFWPPYSPSSHTAAIWGHSVQLRARRGRASDMAGRGLMRARAHARCAPALSRSWALQHALTRVPRGSHSVSLLT